MTPSFTPRLVACLALAITTLAATTQTTFAASGTWTPDSDGNWSDTTKWSGGTVADASTFTADFSTIDITGNRTVTLDSARTISTLKFGDAGATPDFNWTLSGANTLTLGTSAGITVNNQTATISLPLAGTAGLAKTGSGILTLTGANTYSGTTTVGTSANAGILTYSGSGSYAPATASLLNIGGATGKGVFNMNSSGTVNFTSASTPSIGGSGGAADTGIGAFNQTAGTVNLMSGASIYLTIGNNGSGAAYGSVNLSGGTLTATSGSGIRLGYQGLGSLVQSGGTLNCGRFFVIGGGSISGNGVATFTGGSATVNSSQRIQLSDNAACKGTMNLGTAAAGNASVTALNSAAGLYIMTVAGGTTALNLNSGTLTLGGPIAMNASGTAALNLNGGTLKAGASTVTLINNANSLSGKVYNGGVTVDSQGNTATITAGLLATTGNGIYPVGGTLAISSGGGSGYIGAPLVTVSGGSGSGALAIANVSGGVVTGVTMTCPGQNYLAGDVISFAFAGGGATSAASTFNYTLLAGDLAANSTGGLTKLGSGTLALNAANSYKGGTTNAAGTLQLGNASALGATTSPLIVNAGTVNLNANSPTIGSLSGTGGTITDNSAGAGTTTLTVGQSADKTFAGSLLNGSAKSLALVKQGAAKLTLAGANTNSATSITAGTLALSGPGTLASTSIAVSSDAILDVSAISFTLNGSQTLLGSGTNNGSVNTSSGSKIYAGTDGAYGTNTFNNDLTLAAGAAAYLDVGTAYNLANDLISVGGNLTLNNNAIHLKAPSSSVNLDTSADYVLFNVTGTISGSFSSVIIWDVQPLNYGNFSIITDALNKQVRLHYTAATPPTASGTASPTTLVRNQSTTIGVTVTNGSNPISSVTVDASPIGGPGSVTLFNAGGDVYTNDVTVSAATTPGAKTLTATVSDTASLSGIASINLSVIASGEVWNGGGGNDNWSANPNWASGYAPGLASDSVTFAGTTRLTPLMDGAYSVNSVTFDSTAGSFVVGTSGNTLSIVGGVTNNSASGQTLDLPVTLAGAQTFNAAAGGLTYQKAIANGGGTLTLGGGFNHALNAPVSGTGGLTKDGTGTLTITGTNIYTGASTVVGGAVTFAGASSYANSAAPLNVSNGVVNINTTGTIAVTNQVPLGGLDANANASNGAGAIYQTSGTFNALAVDSAYLQLGAGTGAYGYYELSGGTLNTPNGSGVRVGATGLGAFVQSGGALNCSRHFVVGTQTGTGVGGNGVATFMGGTASVGAGSNWRIIVGDKPGSSGALNIGTEAGGTASVSFLNTGSPGLTLAGDGTSAGSTLNLNSGILQLGVPIYRATSAPGVVNLNGGTLQAGLNNVTLINNTPSSVNVYNGGVAVNTGTNAATISANLLGTTGHGVYPPGGLLTIATGGGSGYIGAPLVSVSGGSGSGAMAVATVTSGVVTNVILTCPGQNYQVGDTLNFAFSGGGPASAASTFSYTLTGGDVSPNNTGGLLKSGSGRLILSGASTYGGSTVVSNGTLQVDGSTGSGNVTVVSGATLSGNGTIGGAVNIQSGGFVAAGASIGTLTVSGAATLNGVIVAEITNGPSADKIVFNGGASLGGTLTVTSLGTLSAGNSFDLFDGATSGIFTTLNLPAGGALHWNTSALYTTGVITYNGNASPVANDFSVGVAVGGSVIAQVVGKFVTDADGDALIITSVSAPANGTASIVGGTNIVYTSTNSAAGDSFTYTVSDGLGGTDTKTITVSTYSPEGFNRLSPSSIIGAGTVTLSYLGIPGYSYALDWATNLTPPITWTPVQTNVAATNGYLNFTNTSTEPVNFFRTRYLP